MKLLLPSATLAWVLFQKAVAHAHPADEDLELCAKPPPAIVFANGMHNTQKEAVRSLEALEKFFIAEGIIAKGSRVELAYNNKEGFLDQLTEVISQRLDEERLIEEHDIDVWSVLNGTAQGVPESVAQTLNEQLAQAALYQVSVDKDLRDHLDLYNELLNANHPVLIVAHSQGNLYANLAYEILRMDPENERHKAVGIVAVATPSSYVANGYPHVTLNEDMVINLVRHILPSTLPGTARLGWSLPLVSPPFHAFEAVYLRRQETREQILQTSRETLKALQPMLRPSDIEVITGLLQWDTEAQFHLHVWEPDGTHVYWADPNPVGKSGRLVFDPNPGEFNQRERYMVDCHELKDGLYQFGLSYTTGEAQDSALLQVVSIGSEGASMVVTFAVPGQYTDDNPYISMGIRVYSDHEDRRHFEWQDL